MELKSTFNSPYILIDDQLGTIDIIGRSTMTTANIFFDPVVEAVVQYTNNPPKTTTINIKLEYFNTPTAKYLLHILRILERCDGSETIVIWHYEEGDESILEAGRDYQSIIDIPFKFIEK